MVRADGDDFHDVPFTPGLKWRPPWSFGDQDGVRFGYGVIRSSGSGGDSDLLLLGDMYPGSVCDGLLLCLVMRDGHLLVERFFRGVLRSFVVAIRSNGVQSVFLLPEARGGTLNFGVLLRLVYFLCCSGCFFSFQRARPVE